MRLVLDGERKTLAAEREKARVAAEAQAAKDAKAQKLSAAAAETEAYRSNLASEALADGQADEAAQGPTVLLSKEGFGVEAPAPKQAAAGAEASVEHVRATMRARLEASGLF